MTKNEWENLFGNKENIVPIGKIVVDIVKPSLNINSSDIRIDGKPLEEYIEEIVLKIIEK